MADTANRLQKTFGECIRAERKRHGLSQARLAELAKVSVTYEGEIERGEKMASLDIIVRLAKAFNLTAAQLIEKARL